MSRLFLVHNALTAAVREDVFDGRPYLVAPVVAVKVGVLNGELLTADELSHFVDAWNNRPVVLNHPTNEQGDPIPANSKIVLEQLGLGMLLNSIFVDNGLSGEIWLDLEKIDKLGGDAALCVERLRTHQPIEVSTGYWCDPLFQSGTFNGVRYNAIQQHLRPDHLALLPHDLGACSWQDGCGVPRVNVACTCKHQQDQGQPMKENWLTKTARFLLGARRKPLHQNIQQSADDIESALRSALDLAETLGPTSMIDIEDFYPDQNLVVYCVCDYSGDWGMEKGPLYQRTYTIDANGVATLGDSTEVVEETRYLPVTTNEANPDDLIVNILSSARTPDYSGTETSSWASVTKSLGAYATACTHALGSECPGAVSGMSSEQKQWIASKSLLGDAAATTASDLIFFPVVNPRTGKLNEGALHAVVSGRGAQAKIPDSAKTSAQNKARSLLVKEFNAEPTMNQQQGDDMDKKAKVAAIIKANSMDVAAEAGLMLLTDAQLDKLLPEEPAPAAPVTPAAPAPVMQQAAAPSQAAQDAAYIMNSFAQQAVQQRTQLTEFIVANSGFTAPLLATKSLEELQLLAQMAQPMVNYAGQGFGIRGQQPQSKQGAPDIVPPFEVGVGFVKNGVKIAGTPTIE